MTTTERYDDIRARLRAGTARVFTASEFKALADTAAPDELARAADVVTVATFAPMCSSGVLINFGHDSPPLRMEDISLDGVPAYGGVAAVDAYLGATAELPGNPEYGGAHVIEALVRGQTVRLRATGKGTDCYPGRAADAFVAMDDLNDFRFLNPRNVYQNYGAAANSGDSTLRTYLGILAPRLGTVGYATSGELSPLLNDPELRTVGVGTPIWVAGSVGMVIGPGTQYNTDVELDDAGLPVAGARTLAITADARSADPRFVAAARVSGYGVSLFMGIGLAIPVLDADLARRLSVRDSDITVLVRDYAKPDHPVLLRTTYAKLRSGAVDIQGVSARTSPSSSLAKARLIMAELKAAVLDGRFPIRPPLEALPERAGLKGLAKGRPPAPRPEPARSGPAGYARSLCVDCGACVAHCPAGALAMGPPDWVLRYDAGLCDACGACVPACPRKAFQVAGRS